MSQHRIVSLIASGTELVAALGFEDQLIGRSHECDYPASTERLPICSQPRIDVSGTSHQIDKRVKRALQDSVSIYRVHTELLQQLRPTVIVTQTQCEVCAASLQDVQNAICGIVDSRPTIVALKPNALTDVWNDIQRIAEVLAVPDRGDTLIGELQGRLTAIHDRAQALSNRPSVVCIEWIDPLMAAGNWVPQLVGIAGGINLSGEAGKHSPWLSWEELIKMDPDIIAVMPCGFGIHRTKEEMSVLTEKRQWSQLRAVRNNRVFLADGNQYFNRPGPRLVESAEILAELLHPDSFDFGHAVTGWVRLDHDSGFTNQPD